MPPPAGSADLAWTESVSADVGRLSAALAALGDDELRERIRSTGTSFAASDHELAGFLGAARELAQRTAALRPYDVQLRAAAAMLRGTSVEVDTGEGKTLVGAIVAAGLVRSGQHVHVLAANDYLAVRDATWMGPFLEATGASVSSVTSGTAHEARRDAYLADVVYVPVTEAGFDVLRDRLRLDPSELVGIAPPAAVLDEADAVLLDEGRVPLVLAGEQADAGGTDHDAAGLAASLRADTHYEVDADLRTVHLTEEGLQAVEQRFPGVDLFGTDTELLASVHTALYAEVLLTRDVDYVVENGRVRLISQSRGRVEALQRWPEGLQAAVEAKEGLAPSSNVDILDQLLVQDLIGLYAPVVGMSGTLVSAAAEILELYGLPVGRIPPNRPSIRTDEPDRLYSTTEQRDAAAVALAAEANRHRQPVLVGTQSVAESERFARLLGEAGLASVVLNAKNDAAEAAVIARAGEPGRITVSTQMAGRGTDIHLTGEGANLDGLLVVGLGRFPSKRLDDQLRGRAGRQGDPGRTVFLTSLEDGLVTENVEEPHAARRIADDGTVRDSSLARLTDQAQRISDGQQHSLRNLSGSYGRLLGIHRQHVLTLRREVLRTDRALDLLADLAPERIGELREQLSTKNLLQAARLVVLACLDHRWTEHLAYAAAIREGIHLRALAREDPEHSFNRVIAEAAKSIIDDALTEAVTIVTAARVADGVLDLGDVGLYRPGATWTYTVTDDHFGTEWERAGKTIAKKLGLTR
ncbi:MAG: accessory Sec system translocase SecA2 [Beutenbergiaceae bacterium]